MSSLSVSIPFLHLKLKGGKGLTLQGGEGSHHFGLGEGGVAGGTCQGQDAFQSVKSV